MKSIKSSAVTVSTIGACLLLTITSFIYACRQHNLFAELTFDTALYIRSIWGIKHYLPFNPLVNQHWAALHLQPILFLFTPFADSKILPQILFLSQSVAICSTIFLLYLLAIETGLSKSTAAFTAVAFILYPTTLNLTLQEFHPAVFALPMFTLSMLLQKRDKTFWALLFLSATVLCQEDIAMPAALSAFIFYRTSRKKVWLMAGSAYLLYLSLYLFAIKPLVFNAQFTNFKHHLKASSPALLVTQLLARLPKLFSKTSIFFAIKLFLPLLFIPLLSPIYLLPVLPHFIFMALSDFQPSRSFFSHYFFIFIPFLGLAFINTLSKLSNRIRLIIIVLVMSLGMIFQYKYGEFISPIGRRHIMGTRTNSYVNNAHKIISIIPPNASVRAPINILSHLAQRKGIYQVRKKQIDSDFIIYDLSKMMDISGKDLNKPQLQNMQINLKTKKYRLLFSNPPLCLLIKN